MCTRDEGIRVYNIIVGMYDIMKYEVIMGKSDGVHVYVHVIIIVHDREGSYERCEWLHSVCV